MKLHGKTRKDYFREMREKTARYGLDKICFDLATLESM